MCCECLEICQKSKGREGPLDILVGLPKQLSLINQGTRIRIFFASSSGSSGSAFSVSEFAHPPLHGGTLQYVLVRLVVQVVLLLYVVETSSTYSHRFHPAVARIIVS